MATRAARKRTPTLPDQVVRTVREQQLFLPGQHLLVAVSGGPDSVALLSVLAGLVSTWKLKLTAVHFNYLLRGSESEGDEAFVSALCHEKNIPLLIRFPNLVRGKRQSSVQALARDARYAAMNSIAYEIGADRIAVGHTANDQAETVLMWMLRGAGLTGLSGMPFIREGQIIRPLLAVSRDEVLKYLAEEGLSFREDSSNISSRYRRNRIRRELLPLMEQISPATIRLLQRQANLLREDERYLEHVAREFYASLVKRGPDEVRQFDRRSLAAIPVALQRRLIRMMLRDAEPEGRVSSARVVEDIRKFCLTARERAQLSLRQMELTRHGETILFGKPANSQSSLSVKLGEREKTIALRIPAAAYWPGTKQEIHVQEMGKQVSASLKQIATANRVVLDADLLSEPLIIRSWRPGDRFCPYGMRGRSKKLQDFFTDMKVSRQGRKRIPLLVAPQGILWVVGFRPDGRFLAQEGTTRCLVVTVNRAPESKGAE